MALLLITCTGESTIFAPSRSAVVFITVASEGASQSQISQEVITTANAVQSYLKTMAIKDELGNAHPNAAITHWSMSTLYAGRLFPPEREGAGHPPFLSILPLSNGPGTGSWQPVDKNGKHLPRRFSASTRLEVKFRDFTELGSFTSNLAETKFVSITRIEWRLTDATKAELGRQCRRNAVKDAMLKAKDYADAAGKADFEILEINDGGSPNVYMAQPAGRRMMAAFGGGGAGDGEELNYEPEDASISSSVTARFDAA